MRSRNPFDHDYMDETEPLPDQGGNQVSPVVVGVAIFGLAAGLFLWGSLALSVIGGIGTLFDDGSPAAREEDSIVTEDVPIDCDAFGEQRALSPDQEAAYQEQCAAPAAGPDATPAQATRLNRADCEEIRGTDYRSPEEREWFLDNCVSN